MKVTEVMGNTLRRTIISKGVELLGKDPDKNIDKLFNLIRKMIKDEDSLNKINAVYDSYENNPAIKNYIHNMVKTTDPKCMAKLFTNFFVNSVWYGMPKRAKLLQEEGIKTPFTILISPSMRCNLKCTGCYASNYSKEDDIPYEEVDRIVKEARDLGIYFFIVLGGEPFFNKDMIKIYEKYNDMVFVPFTNGTLFNEELADKIKDLGNVLPMFSLEGFEEETDARRGEGIFKSVMNGMELLKERGVLFGVSSAVGRHNIDTVISDKFIDMLIEKGAKMSWYFIFMPVGENPDFNLMLTPKQRLKLGEGVRRIRSTKPYFAIDFFNDAPYVGGCIAGKYYCHINSKEDVEPCIFAHFATDNLKGKPLVEAFKTDFFKELRNNQPYNENLLLPCMMIDNPEVIRNIAKKVGANPTDKGAEMMLHDKKFQAKLNKISQEFKPHAEKAWKDDFDATGNYSMSKG